MLNCIDPLEYGSQADYSDLLMVRDVFEEHLPTYQDRTDLDSQAIDLCVLPTVEPQDSGGAACSKGPNLLPAPTLLDLNDVVEEVITEGVCLREHLVPPEESSASYGPSSGSGVLATGENSEYDVLVRRRNLLDEVLNIGETYYSRIKALHSALIENIETGALQYGVVFTETFGGLAIGSAAGTQIG